MELNANFDYSKHDKNDQETYNCVIVAASIQTSNIEIKKVKAKHLKFQFENEDVQLLRFKSGIYGKSIIHYIPRGIDKIYPNITYLYIENCGLKSISRDDFKGFDKLIVLKLDKNELKILPDDLFKGMLQLNEISFAANKIEIVSSKLFAPIKTDELCLVDFRENVKIDATFIKGKSFVSFEMLMEMLDTECISPIEVEQNTIIKDAKEKHKETAVEGLDDLRRTGAFSDFTITAGANEFKVHRLILSLHSQTIREWMDNECHENEMKINEYSPETVEQLIKYVYTGEISKDANPIDLYKIAKQYGFLTLESICEKLIVNSVSQANVEEVMSFAYDHNLEALKKKVLDVVKEIVPQEQMVDDLEASPEKLKTLIQATVNYKRKFQENESELALIVENLKKPRTGDA